MLIEKLKLTSQTSGKGEVNTPLTPSRHRGVKKIARPWAQSPVPPTGVIADRVGNREEARQGD
jgi:hypothetical protein